MREVSKLMIKKYCLKQLKCDFMGYPFDNIKQLSFHHLIIPHWICKMDGISSNGFLEWNGAILRQNTAHDYLHIIERYDLDMFEAITSEMIDENLKGYLSEENIRYIDDVLSCFEREYSGKSTKKGLPIIKEEYVKRLMRKKD